MYKFRLLLFLLCCFTYARGQSFNPNDPVFLQRVQDKLQKTELYNQGLWPDSKGDGVYLMASPEQDCDNAIAVCQNSYTQTVSYSGPGDNVDINSGTTCLGTGETNSVWYIFTVQNSGTFTFTINTQQDYDFALYNITGTNCSAIPGMTPVRCNYSADYGTTGLVLPAAGGNISVDASGNPTMPGVNVTAGQTFVLIVNNFTGNTTGYTLTFGGTASIFDTTPPSILTATPACPVTTTVTLTFSENISCASLAGNGSDFQITGPSVVNVLSATSAACAGGAAFTNQVVLTISAPTVAGNYSLSIKAGTDGNTIADNCNNFAPVGGSLNIPMSIPASIAGPTSTCEGNPVTLTASAGTSYIWNTGATTQSINVTPSTTTTYFVDVIANGCTSRATHVLTINNAPIAAVSPDSSTICGAGTITVTATALFGGAPCVNCNYSWSNGTVQNGVPSSSITVGAGTYTVTVTDPTGLCGSSTATSQLVTVSGPPVPACNNIYVTPTGSGTGLTQGSPTNLTTALTLAQCNNATIKMAVGDYTITSPIFLGSYTTIEGGFNSTFTDKTSSMATAGAFPNRGTRIIRTNASVDPGSPAATVGNTSNPRNSAVVVAAGSQFFRLQDLRIEVQNFAAGTRVTNYGIYLGAGCANYNITRCWVDAGTGANGISGTAGTGFATNALAGSNGADADGSRTGGAGGGVAGAARSGGAGGTGGAAGNNNGTNGTQGRDPSGALAGTNGVNTTSSSSGAGGNSHNNTSCFGCCDDPGGCTSNGCGTGARGKDGVAGANGTDGASGVNGTAPTFTGGYFMPGGNGGNGSTVGMTDGSGGGGGGGGGGQRSDLINDEGAGGGGGGQGGRKALTAGTGGIAGGGAFAVFSVSRGAGANVVDCNLFATAGAAGAGGAGGSGEGGGIGGAGGAQCDGGGGGNGGNGGRGGNAGSGGTGPAGQAGLVVDLVGTTLTTIAHTNLALDQQQLVTATNINCTAQNLTLTTNNATPSWLSLGVGASAANPNTTSTPITTQYANVGRKTLSLGNGSRSTTQLFPWKWFPSDNTANVAIADNALTTVNLTVSGYTDNGGNVPATGVFVTTAINHTFIGDLELYLQAPDGKILKLVENRGGAGGNMWAGFVNTVWTDAEAAVMPAAITSTSAGWRPIGTLTTASAGITPTVANFAAMGGTPANGVWKLYAYDDAGGDVGEVLWWEISFGGYLNAADAAIPDGNATTGVTSNITVAGMPNPLVNAGNMVVQVNLEHAWDSDVDLYLTAPNGSRIRLSTDNGGSDMDYSTRFADFATQNVTAFTAPFWGYLRPEGGLGTENGLTPNISTFAALNGSDPNGTWQLRAFDDAGGDIGNIRFWAIDFADESRIITTTGITDNYTDFIDISTIPGAINTAFTTTPDSVCPNGKSCFEAVTKTGVIYEWKIFNPSNVQIGTFGPSALLDTTCFTFPATPGNYNVRLVLTSICCGNKDSLTKVVVVRNTPTPIVTATPNTICPGDVVVLSTDQPSNSTFLWNTGQLTPTITVSPSATTTYTVDVVTPAGCILPQASATVTVKPVPVATISGNASVCAGSSLTLTATSAPVGATFAWTGLTVGAGNSVTFTPAADGFVYVTPTLNGCVGQKDSVYVQVTPKPIPVILNNDTTICVGNTVRLYASGGKQYEWTLTYNGAPFATGDSIDVTPGTTTEYYLWAYFDDCKSATPDSMTITVNPLNTVAAGTNQTVCINTAITNITLATTGATGATVTGLPAGVTGSWAANVVTISGTPTASGTFNYTVTTTGGCPPATTTGTITVNPANTVAAGTNQTVCINNAITNITLATTGATGATVTGLPTGVTGSWAANVVTISGTPTVSGTFNYTVTTTGGCPANTTGTITVNPANTVAAGTNQTVCINTAITNITLATTGATGATVTGLPAGVTGTWAANVVTISGTPTASGTFNYTVTTTGGCPPATTTGTITVNPLNTVASGTNQTVCVNTAITNISLATTGATGATVTGLPAGVTGTWAANTVTISGTPTATGIFNYTVTTTGGCPPATTTGTITVNQSNTVAAGSNQTVCINTAITNITLATTGATGATVTGLPAGVTGTWAANVVTISGTPTASGTFNYTVTTTGGCPPATTTGTITVNPLNTVAAGTNQTVCINSAITNISLATTGATGATVTGLPAGVTGTWAANVVTISGTPTASGTFNYTVTTTGGCPPATTIGTITVNPTNTIAAGANRTTCINTAITNITMATTGATGATFSGLPTGVTGSWAGNIATISGTPTVSGTFNYTVTTTGGCPPATTTGTITVNPANTVAAGTNQTVCVNNAITNISLATTGATGATVTGLPAGVTGTWAANVVTISGTPTATGTFNYTVTTTGGCPPATTTGTITVNPANTIAAGTNQTVCVNTAISNISLATTGATGATVSGLPAGVTGSWAANVVTISGTPTATGTFNYTVTTTGGCPPSTTTGTITVNPSNTVAAGTNQTVCINSAITNITLATTGATGATVTGLPAGVTGTWAANVVTISGTPTASGTFNYTVTTTGGCPPATTTGTITVNPNNTVAAGTNQTVCVNTAIANINLATTGATGATVSGLPAGVTGVWAANIVTISGTPTVSGTFNYTVTTTGGCPPATTSGTITVNPNNTVAAGTNQTVCINTAITNITLATTGATGATITGLPTGVIGSWAANTVTISGTPTVSGTFNYVVTTTGGCPPAVTNGTITVILNNTIAAGTNVTTCVNSPMTSITLATSGATGATVTGLPAGVTGTWAANAVTISGTPTATGTFNYTVTTTGGCPPGNTTGTITVNPTNTVAAGTNQTVCINTAITNITLATTGATGATVTGLPAGVTGTWAANTVTISGTPSVSGTFNYTVTTTGGCPPATTTGTITVNPANTIAAGSSQTVCINTAITNISLATTGATGATFTGLPAGVTGTWAANVVTISGTPTASGVFNYTVTTTGGCPPATTSGTITVNPLNTVAAGTNQTVCINSAITTITLATTGATGATVSGLPAGVTGTWAANAVTISGTPTVSGTFNYTVTTTGGCPPATTTGTITVNPINTIAAGTNQTVCINSAITTINLATTGATGATFTGLPAGVTGTWAANVATISGTPTVSGTFNYTVTTTGGCTASTNGTITVTPLNTIVAGTNQTVCINSAITNINLATTGATGATVSGLPAGVTGTWSANVVTISGIPTASGVFSYTVTTTGGCPPATTTGTITVNPLNTVATGTNQTVCINSAISNITLATTGATGATVTGLPTGVTGTWAANTVTISGTPTVSGTFNYTVTTTGGCPPATTTGTITVNPLNTVATGTNQTVCVNSPISDITLATTGATGATVSGLPTGVNGTWSANVVTITGTPTVSGTFNYTVTTTGGCPPATTTGTITVNPIPVVVAGSNSPLCENATLNLTATTIAGATYSWTGPNGFVSNQQNPTIFNANTGFSGTYDVVAIVNGCSSVASSVNVVINAAPAAPTLTSDSPVCAGSTLSFTASATIPGVTYFWNGPNGFSSTLQNPSIPNATVLATGTYNCVTILNGCTSTVATINAVVNPIPANPTVSPVTICTNNTATIVASAPAGATFNWYDAANTLVGVGNNFVTGVLTTNTTYFVEAIVNSCTSARIPVTVTVNPIPATPTVTDAGVCEGFSATLIASAPVGASFNWYSTAVGGVVLGTGQSFTTPNLSVNTTYFVETVNAGCTSARVPVNVTVTPAPVVASTTPVTICEGLSATISAVATPGATINWYDAGSGGNLVGTGSTFTVPVANTTTTYFVEAELNGCRSARIPVTITVNPSPVAPSINSVNVCSGESALIQVSTTPNTQYVWYDATGTQVFTGSSMSIPNMANDTLFFVEAISSGCTSATRSTAIVNVTQRPIVNFTSTPDTGVVSFLPNTTYTFTNLSSNFATSFVWDFGDGTIVTTTSLTEQPTHTYTKGGVYTVKLTAYNGAGCADSIMRGPYIIEDEVRLFLPNSFTPNGDGHNDEFIYSALGAKTVTMQIWDRWGTVVYETLELQNFWNGKHSKSGQDCPEGVYVYKIKVIGWNEKTYEHAGSITLLR